MTKGPQKLIALGKYLEILKCDNCKLEKNRFEEFANVFDLMFGRLTSGVSFEIQPSFDKKMNPFSFCPFLAVLI